MRVFARVRPFLPSDGVGPDEVPAVVGKGDGVGCVVSKRLAGDGGKELPSESQSFSFDKCFPPRSVSQTVSQAVGFRGGVAVGMLTVVSCSSFPP